MDRSSEDALWRSIVENYGDRAELDRRPAADGDAPPETVDEPTAEPTADAPPTPVADSGGAEPGPAGPSGPGAADGDDHEAARAREADDRGRAFDAVHGVPDRFVPPEPPPLPYVEPSRLAAWSLLLAGPLLLLASLVLGYPLPGVVQFLAAGGFVGGFVYLVARMPRDPRDPWDDGARV